MRTVDTGLCKHAGELQPRRAISRVGILPGPLLPWPLSLLLKDWLQTPALASGQSPGSKASSLARLTVFLAQENNNYISAISKAFHCGWSYQCTLQRRLPWMFHNVFSLYLAFLFVHNVPSQQSVKTTIHFHQRCFLWILLSRKKQKSTLINQQGKLSKNSMNKDIYPCTRAHFKS